MNQPSVQTQTGFRLTFLPDAPGPFPTGASYINLVKIYKIYGAPGSKLRHGLVEINVNTKNKYGDII